MATPLALSHKRNHSYLALNKEFITEGLESHCKILWLYQSHRWKGGQMTPLYRFQLNENTGVITRTAIEDYHITHPSSYMPKRVHYCYMTRGIRHDIHGENIDKFVNWQVYSFSGDEEHAKNIMISNLRARYKQALLDTKRFATVIDKLGGFEDGENQQQS